MMKIALLVAVLFVSANAKAFPFGFLNNNPNNMDTPDDDQQRVAGRRVGVAGQAFTSMAPAGGSSSDSSSSEEDMDSIFPAGGATTPVAGPIQGAGVGAAGGAAAAGDNSNNNDAIVPAAGGPIIEKAAVQEAVGNSGELAQQQAIAYFANPLNMKAQTSDRKRQGRQSGFLLAMTVLGLIVGVAALSFTAYRHKEYILVRLGWH